MPMIYAMVLAAGRSRRMGTQKLLLPLGDRPVIVHIVDEVLRSPVDQVFVVVGPGGHGVVEAIANRSVRLVTNPDPEGDMLSSVRCALSAMPEDCAAVLTVLGDQPGITAEVVAVLVQAFRTSGHGIIVPTYHGRRGHPLLFSRDYREEILCGYQGVGLQGLLHAHPEDVCEVELPAPGVIEDMDLPEEYEKIAKMFKNKPESGGSE
jgi:molybdenum cofactor cytidylyltransferase